MIKKANLLSSLAYTINPTEDHKHLVLHTLLVTVKTLMYENKLPEDKNDYNIRVIHFLQLNRQLK